MVYDDHTYCTKCDRHSRNCWCYSNSTPEEDGEADTACSGGEGHD
jgi:hypothetical protein